ncbi:MAG: glycosyltransferase family 4 protein [Methylococcaceae bacterium]|nr:glycosyltransferase family 4 protein [Methylococcaceae bacterium]MCI0668195.1 glycosyltransferase family 4 protein [Methylococcaceae bacterium]MCI0732339.1 glycosyltransferase family 4 protein [Methylococcaceae bacterium]
MRTVRILTFSTLYPNNVQKGHGIFVEQRLRHLLKLGGVECRVVAPVPWFPSSARRFGRYALFSKIHSREERFGIPIDHPRYPVIPKIGMTIAPLLLAIFAYPAVSRLLSGGYEFDLIDAHYYYPDGVAAVMLAKWLNKPVVITARGTDINLIPDYILPHRMILWAAGKADRSITVCQALKDEMIRLGADADKIHVFRNGVDLECFQPLDYVSIRKKLGINRPTLLSVGHLVERKGHHLVIEALRDLPEYQLLIAGDGEELRNLENLVREIDVADRVIFLGALSHAQLVEYYSAVDSLVLASSREGWANVLLESMACGTPVVATRIWGTPEVVTRPEAGILIDDRSGGAIAAGVRQLMMNPPSRTMTRKYAENFAWESSVRAVEETFRAVLEKRNSS